MSQSVLSPEFLAVGLAAVILLNLFQGLYRQFLFLGLNVLFVAGFLLPPIAAAGVGAMFLIGYIFVRLDAHVTGWLFAGGLLLLVSIFAYMRNYDFLTLFLPDAFLTSTFAVIGLSFLFFKIIHVIVDHRAGTIGRLDFLTYTNYCLNFSTFLMGPIQRYQDYEAQWNGTKEAIPLKYEAHLDAVLRMLIGFAKAFVLAPIFQAEALTPDIDLVALTPLEWLIAVYCFWFYLYLNFSGYCDVVIGLGSLMGIRPPENFNRPFLARNISDFWQRQHRSLTLWLTDYVFTPLYKQSLSNPWLAARKTLAVCLCLMATMMVSGLWHGTTLSFFFFGIIHGIWFVIYRLSDTLLTQRLGRQGMKRFRQRPIVAATGMFLTFNATAFAFVFFQVSSDRIIDAIKTVAGA
ncbi:MAG: MBOAT family O-acyltransferase [Pseudomonadota bacterium]